MNLSLFNPIISEKYKSSPQKIRVLSEHWFITEMYCPYCSKKSLVQLPNNNKAGDFSCKDCYNIFELKSANKLSDRIVNGEYYAMIAAIDNFRVPNFMFLNYSSNWIVKNLFIIPKFLISFSMIEKRKPLSESAQRAGWTGCNILLNKIPEEGKISIIKDEKIMPVEIVLRNINKINFLNNKDGDLRGWTLDVLRCVEDLRKKEFELDEIYKFEDYLKNLHPQN